jgi:hypothetical protein
MALLASHALAGLVRETDNSIAHAVQTANDDLACLGQVFAEGARLFVERLDPEIGWMRSAM